jgi:hypothetical protein
MPCGASPPCDLITTVSSTNRPPGRRCRAALRNSSTCWLWVPSTNTELNAMNATANSRSSRTVVMSASTVVTEDDFAVSFASISALMSTPTTSSPRSARGTVSRPVPAPNSRSGPPSASSASASTAPSSSINPWCHLS